MPAHQPADIALVTAGAKRLGKAMVLQLAERGYDIALHFHTSKGEAQAVKQEVESGGRRCELFQADLSQTDQILSLVPAVRQRMGAARLLINNASVFEKNTLSEALPEEFDLDFDIHVKAPFFLIRDFARDLDKGHVINIVDTAVTRTKTEYFTYLLSKKALHELTQMAAQELAPRIRVNEIAPGVIMAPPGVDSATFQKFSLGNPLQRAAGPADVLLALDYLLKSEQVTGQCLFVDGGDHIAC